MLNGVKHPGGETPSCAYMGASLRNAAGVLRSTQDERVPLLQCIHTSWSLVTESRRRLNVNNGNTTSGNG
jgi:hypothetical protein